ncbi:MAG TPA: magnesium chelatase domain-containing protein [Syntrophorhabdaceae bacterium]|nr:magnesium chelatase domain-containing protein [Syntrophorhabdaceae bacterium]
MTGHDIFRYITLPVDFNNPVAAFERLFSIDIPAGAKSNMARRLIELISEQPLTEMENKEIERMVLNSKGIFRNKKSILEALSSKSDTLNTKPAPNDSLGKTQCLFVIEEGNHPFGYISSIVATTINDGKGDHKLVAKELSDQVYIAFYTACEAVRFVFRDYGLKGSGYSYFDNYGITVQVGRLKDTHDGSSMCLAISIAIISSLIGMPVNGEVAFTGVMNIAGEIEPVEGIEEKIRIATFKGMKQIYVPLLNTIHIKPPQDVELIPVSRLKDVIDGVFGEKVICQFVADLNGKGKAVTESLLLLDSKGKEKVLISTVGMRDPYGASYHDKENSQFTEGPIITAFRRISPGIVILIPTKETYNNALKTKAEIDRMAERDICHIRMIDIKDPTDYDDIYIAILAVINSIRDIISGKDAYISISSGTPQMHTVLIELLRSKKLVAHPIQVREPKFATSWEDRVRPIKSEYLNIGNW